MTDSNYLSHYELVPLQYELVPLHYELVPLYVCYGIVPLPNIKPQKQAIE